MGKFTLVPLRAGEPLIAADLSATPGNGDLASLDPAIRLALEMAAHEEIERQALEGELALLEMAWRAPEEIAAHEAVLDGIEKEAKAIPVWRTAAAATPA